MQERSKSRNSQIAGNYPTNVTTKSKSKILHFTTIEAFTLWSKSKLTIQQSNNINKHQYYHRRHHYLNQRHQYNYFLSSKRSGNTTENINKDNTSNNNNNSNTNPPSKLSIFQHSRKSKRKPNIRKHEYFKNLKKIHSYNKQLIY